MAVKTSILSLLLVCLTLLVSAQTDTLKRATAAPIQLHKGGFWHSDKYMVGSKILTGKEISYMLCTNERSGPDFKLAVSNHRKAFYTAGVVSACLVASLIVNKGANEFQNSQSKILAGVGTALIIPEYIFAHQRDKHFKKSIELYNQQF